MYTRLGLAVAAIMTGTLVGPSPATAAAPLCQGKEATIVAEPGRPDVVGTEGPDVIVAKRFYVDIDARGGDDTICFRGGVLWAGDGNDSVLSTSREDESTNVDLGPGDDIYTGGAGADYVEGLLEGDSGKDVIATGPGSDWVRSGTSGEPNLDVVDLGSGADGVDVTLSSGSGARVTGGDDADHDRLIAGGGGADYVQDLTAGTMLSGGLPVLAFSSFDSFHTWTDNQRAIEVVGSSADDQVDIRAADITVNLLGGNDHLGIRYPGRAAGSGVLNGGTGRDRLALDTRRDLLVDLKAGTLEFRSPRSTGRLMTSSFEEVTGYARHARVAGSAGRDRIAISGCRVDLRGRDGRDVLRVPGSPVPQCRGRLYGGPGADVLRGGVGNDVLIGGPGHDRAFGVVGTDTCRAERELSCER